MKKPLKCEKLKGRMAATSQRLASEGPLSSRSMTFTISNEQNLGQLPGDAASLKPAAYSGATLVSRIEAYRMAANQDIPPHKRSELGQFMTPAPVASLMASMFRAEGRVIHLLDAGAGVGSLTAAFIVELCGRATCPSEISVTLFEVDPTMVSYLRQSMRDCAAFCATLEVKFDAHIVTADFITAAAEDLTSLVLAVDLPRYNCAILNPPYRKISADSEERRTLRVLGIETSNLYTAFVWTAFKLMSEQAEVVAITPRSFCNGPYFRPFRHALLSETVIRRLHVFESRLAVFRDDDVLQENIIFHAQKKPTDQGLVTVSTSEGPTDPAIYTRDVEFPSIVHPGDQGLFIHIPHTKDRHETAARIHRFTKNLSAVGISVSTGRVVDFRAKEYLRDQPDSSTVPLVYPCHMSQGTVKWPRLNGRKPNAILRAAETEDLLLPNEVFVLVKRFTTKEERRRVVASLYEPSITECQAIGFENHLNVFQCFGTGMPLPLAKGLVIYLNSTTVDEYFRQFNGHTQVNAADLRSLTYPSSAQLEELGRSFHGHLPSQDDIDAALDRLEA